MSDPSLILFKVGALVTTGKGRKRVWRMIVQGRSDAEAVQLAWLFLEGRMARGKLWEVHTVRVHGKGQGRVVLVNGFLEGRPPKPRPPVPP